MSNDSLAYHDVLGINAGLCESRLGALMGELNAKRHR